MDKREQAIANKLRQLFQKPSLVTATIEFHHIKREGDLWVDWTNELKAGKQRVWKVVASNIKQEATKISETGRYESFGNVTVSPTIQSQIFTTFMFALTNLNPSDTFYRIEPVDPYNRLGVKKLFILKKGHNHE